MTDFEKNVIIANKQRKESDKVFCFDVIAYPPMSADKITAETMPNGKTIYHCKVFLD